MRIVFISNYYNHHQAHISRMLHMLTHGEYYFISTIGMPDERKKLGYADVEDAFVIHYYENASSKKDAHDLIDTADVVIMGSAPERLLRIRKKHKRMILRYAERPLKKGFQWWKYPIRWLRWHKDNPRGVPIYMLCASAYTAPDYARFGMFKNRMYKWGYFPECKRYENIEELMARKNRKEILWCGRFLDWKHPDDALEVAARLKRENYSFHINIIGTGVLEEKLNELVSQNELSDVVTFSGSMSPELVRKHMERAGIYLLTSDYKEGWGAVLNEAMNSGCAIIASHACGSVPFLIDDNKNGLIYESGNVDMLFNKTKLLLDSIDEQQRLGIAAYHSIIKEWNAESAAVRLIQLIECLGRERSNVELFKDGPCSLA